MNSLSLPKLLSPYKYFGVGSLPYNNVDDAFSFIFARNSLLPFWPELPRKDAAERMIERAERAAHPRWEGYSENEAAGLFALISRLKSGAVKLPIIKCQVPGPLTLATVSEKLTGSFEGKLLEAREVCFRQIKWQSDLLKEFKIPLLVVVDEPCLGKAFDVSAERWNQTKTALSYLYTRATELGVFFGVHCCGDCEVRCSELALDLCSFDLTGRYDIKAFERDIFFWRGMIGRGVVLSAGVYRSVIRSGEESDEIQRGDKTALRVKELLGAEAGQILFSTSCGMAHASPNWCDLCYR